MHIPTLARNLIYVSNLDDAGVKPVFEKDTCNMVRGALVRMRGVRIGTLYKMQGSTIVDGCNSSVVPESGAKNLVVSRENTMLWNQRLGHIGEKGLQILHGNVIVEGMTNSSLDLDFYENYVYGKQNQVSFSSGGKRAKQILELVHSDVFGPVKVPSLDKSVTVKEAADSEDGKLGKEAMFDEMESLHKNEVCNLVELSAGRKPISSKCVFRKKTNAEGKVEKYKARLVVKGYSQVPGIDFGDIFSLVSKVASIRLLLSVVVAFYFEVE
eukprot:PITA_34723